MRNRAQLDEMNVARDWLIRQDERAGLLYWLMPEVKDMSQTEKALYATVSVIGCGAAINNAGVAAGAKP